MHAKRFASTLLAAVAMGTAVCAFPGSVQAMVQPAFPQPVAVHASVGVTAAGAVRVVTVAQGDSLAGIAARVYGKASDWPVLYVANRDHIRWADVIGVGVRLRVPPLPPRIPPVPRRLAAPVPHVAAHTVTVTGTVTADHSAARAAAAAPLTVYGPGALETLWTAAGGSPAAAGTAECIAEAESGGDPAAESPTDDFGLWQEHADPAALSPPVSARLAVQMSGDGTNWSAWTTAASCGV